MQQFVTKARVTTANATAAATNATNRGASTKSTRPSPHHFHTTSKCTKATSTATAAVAQDRQSKHMSSSPLRNSYSLHFSEPSSSKSSSPIHKTQQQRHLSHYSDSDDDNTIDSERFQSILKTRRTTSNFKPLLLHDQQQQQLIKDAIYRAVECAIQAPNHYRTEPTTYYQITPHTTSWEQLLNITYNVVLNKTKKPNESEEETMIRRMKAENKRNKWRDTIGGFIVVCVGGQPDQITLRNENGSHEDEYEILPLCPPETERQMEDYATACASIQNILLSLHSEGLGAKWATGSIPRCKAMRELVGCQNDEFIAGLVMVGIPNVPEPKEWRRRRAFVGNVFKDLS